MVIGKREAESDPAIHVLGRAPITSVGAFTTYANGAVVPTDTPAVAAATAQHLAAKGTPILHDTYATVAHVGYAGYPFAHYGHYLGKREAESDAEAYYGVYGLGYGYGLHHVPAVTSVGGKTSESFVIDRSYVEQVFCVTSIFRVSLLTIPLHRSKER